MMEVTRTQHHGTCMLPLSTRILAFVVAAIFTGTIATTYTLCIYNGHCPKLPHLPTISDTWITPPGNYISRFTVNLGSSFFFLGNIIVYWINVSRRSEANSICKLPSNKTLLVLSQIAVVCLSFVGAICDTSKSGCEGNGSLHTASAVTFFILYDFVLICDYHIPTSEKHQLKSPRLLAFTLVISLLSKARFFVPMDQTPLAIFEWSDVLCIMLFLVKYLLDHGAAFVSGFTLIDPPSAPSRLPSKAEQSNGYVRVTTLSTMTADAAALCAVAVGVATLLATYIVSVKEGAVPKDVLPNISDMWVKPPANWIARWGIMVTSTFLSLAHLCYYYLRTTGFGSRPAQSSNFLQLMLAVGGAASVLLGVMAIVEEPENDTLHQTAADAFFIAMTVYMIGTIADQLLFTAQRLNLRFLVLNAATLLMVMSKVRYSSHWMHRLDWETSKAVAVLQWVDVLCVGVFTVANICFRAQNVSQRLQLGVFQHYNDKGVPSF